MDTETRADHIRHCNFRFRKRLFELARPEKGSRRPSNFKDVSERVLIDYDGSVSAVALLNLIRDTLRSSSEITLEQKCLPLPFTFSILFIYDETDSNKELMIKELDSLRTWQAEAWSKFGLDFPIILTSLECSMYLLTDTDKVDGTRLWKTIDALHKEDESEAEVEEINKNLPFDLLCGAHLMDLANNIKTETSRKDFLLQMRQNLLLCIVQKLGIKKVIVAENQTAMAVKMLSTISLGRGAQLAEQMVFITELQDIKFARPLMDLAKNDLEKYVTCIQLENETEAFTDTGSTSLLKKNVVKGKTIESQCEEFIVDLQKNFPSTVPTLTRIGSKLQPCQPSTRLDVQDAGTSSHTTFPLCTFCKKNREPGRGEQAEAEAASVFHLCYGCTNILRDMKDQSLFSMNMIHQP